MEAAGTRRLAIRSFPRTVPHRALPCALVILAALSGAAAASVDAKLDPHARIARAAAAAATDRSATAAATPVLDVFVLGDASAAALEARGAIVRTRLPGLHTASIPLDRLEEVAALAGVHRILGSIVAEPALDQSASLVGIAALRAGPPAFAGLNGHGVLVGIVDSGLDLDHPDFLDPAGNTRVVALWDQTRPAGPPPAGFATGTLWTQAQIDAGLCTQLDTNGHGTLCLGIAAGDGSGTGGAVPAFTYVGMAPAADLAVVKSDYSTTQIVDGVRWIFDLATQRGQAAVVNLSLGYQSGPHDGTSPVEAALSLMSGPGRIVCAAAHNHRGTPLHGEAVTGATPDSVTIAVTGSADGGSFRLDGYYDSGDLLELTIVPPSGTPIGPIGLVGDPLPYPGFAHPCGNVYVHHDVYAPHARQIYVEVNVGSGQSGDGTWTLRFSPVVIGAAGGEVDLWRRQSGLDASFVIGSQPFEEMVSEPGNADSVIAVGSYTSRTVWPGCYGTPVGTPGPHGALSYFSNAGPSRDGRIKPDLVAPGDVVASSTSFDAPPVCPAPGVWTPFVDDGLHHHIAQGTSLSTPHVVGAVALLLQTDPGASPARIKAILQAQAVTDGFTGAVPNPDWGWGKLHLSGSIVAVGPASPGRQLAIALAAPRPQPAHQSVEFVAEVPAALAARIRIHDPTGRRVRTLVPEGPVAGAWRARWDRRDDRGARVPPGIYFAVLEAGGERARRRCVVLD